MAAHYAGIRPQQDKARKSRTSLHREVIVLQALPTLHFHRVSDTFDLQSRTWKVRSIGGGTDPVWEQYPLQSSTHAEGLVCFFVSWKLCSQAESSSQVMVS